MFSWNKTPKLPERPVTEQSLRGWLIDAVAQRLSIEPTEVDTGKSFEDYGLDSRAGIQLSGQMEKILERRLSPALLYQHPTIDSLIGFLAKDLPQSSPA